MAIERESFEGVCLKGEVFVFSGPGFGNTTSSIEKYSPSTDTWNIVTNISDDRG